MIDLTTQYMGIRLKTPILAGAIVTASLFEEQIQLERFKMDEDREKYNNRHAEMITVFPEAGHAGPKEHLRRVRKTRKNPAIPVIASLNAVHVHKRFSRQNESKKQ